MTPTHMGMSFGMRARGGAYDPWFSNGNTDINHYFGANADELYLPGEPASGSITGKIASNILSPVGTPTYQQALTGAPGDPLGCGGTNGTSDSFDAANAGIHDSAGTAFALLSTIDPTPATNASRDLLGKYSTNGYRLITYLSGVGLRVILRGTGGTEDMIFNTAHPAPSYVFIGYSAISDEGYFHTQLASDSGTGIGNMTNVKLFSLGSNAAVSAGCVIGPTTIWSGAAAEAVITNRVASLAAWAADAGVF